MGRKPMTFSNSASNHAPKKMVVLCFQKNRKSERRPHLFLCGKHRIVHKVKFPTEYYNCHFPLTLPLIGMSSQVRGAVQKRAAMQSYPLSVQFAISYLQTPEGVPTTPQGRSLRCREKCSCQILGRYFCHNE